MVKQVVFRWAVAFRFAAERMSCSATMKSPAGAVSSGSESDNTDLLFFFVLLLLLLLGRVSGTIIRTGDDFADIMVLTVLLYSYINYSNGWMIYNAFFISYQITHIYFGGCTMNLTQNLLIKLI